MKKTIAFGIVFLLVVMSFTSISGIQIDNNIIKSSSRGNILYVGGSGEGNYTKIQDAIDNSSDGDTVFVYADSSPYYEWDIFINKSINLIGENRDTTIIDGKGTTFIIALIKNNVNVSGFSIINGIYGIQANIDNHAISDNNFINCYFGIELWSSECCVISNMFSKCEVAISGVKGDNNRISNNIIYGSSEQVYTYGDITCERGNNHVITNNTFISINEDGGRIGIYLLHSNKCIIEDNVFNGYDGVAISLFSFARNNIISHNTFINNNLGVRIGTVSGSNRIINNNFINNLDDVLFGFLTFNNVFDGNYWDEWIGVKYPLPIFQKLPKLIFSPFKFSLLLEVFGSFRLYIDWNPAKEPYNYTTTQGCEIE